MKKLSHITFSNKKILSFTIIPSTTNKIIQFSIPFWLPILSMSLLLILSIYTISISKIYLQSQEHLTKYKNQLVLLQSENQAQAMEIDYLQGKYAIIEEKLQTLNELQSKILNMVGLEDTVPQSTTANPISFLVSRSDVRTPILDFDLEEDVIDLSELIEKQTSNLEKLVVDIEKQVKYIDSLPNLRPTTGRLSSSFGYRISPISRRREFHSGIDIANKTKTNIVAAGSGIVTFSGYNGGYGRMVMISHGHGYTTVYAHNSQNIVKVGDLVKKSDVIAKMGSTGNSTGPHLHFEIRKNGKPIDPKTVLEN